MKLGISLSSLILLILAVSGCSNEFKVNNIMVYPQECDLYMGDSIMINAVVDYEGGDFRDPNQIIIEWESEDESIATVTSKGKVKGLSLGNTEIMAKCGDKTAKCILKVVPKMSSEVTGN